MNDNTHHKISHSPKPAQQSGKITLSTPQRSPVHSTLQQNQNTHHSTGRDAPAPVVVQVAGIQSPTLGINKHIPHKDGSTQMPSQEIHLIRINQGTQMPSQQWEQTPTPEDHDPTQTEAATVLSTASQDTSHKLETYRATHTGIPTHSPTPKINTTNTTESCPDGGIHTKTASIQEEHDPTLNLTSDTGTDEYSDNQNNNGTTNSKVMNPQPSDEVHIKSDKQFPKHSAVEDKPQLEPNTTTNKDNPHTNSQTINPDLPMQSTNKQSCRTTIANASPGQNNTNNSHPEITILKREELINLPICLPTTPLQLVREIPT